MCQWDDSYLIGFMFKPFGNTECSVLHTHCGFWERNSNQNNSRLKSWEQEKYTNVDFEPIFEREGVSDN